MCKTFFLIDATLYAYKSYYIINYKKKNINFKKSFLVFWNMIFSKYKFCKPNYLLFVFDYDRNNFRKKICKKYKSNRKKIPKELLLYISNIKFFFNVFGIKYFSYPNVEGDDVIGSLICKINSFFLNKKDYLIYILSYDKDFLQLVNNNVYLFVSFKEIFDPKLIYKKYGVYPNSIIDLLVLCGDKSDNIPGIKGIGFKKAPILINNIGNIKEIYKNLFKIKNLKIRNYINIVKNLKLNINKINLWYSLIKIKLDVKIKFDLHKFKTNSFFFLKVFNWLKNFNFCR